jgi:hypothetical protein
MQFSVEAVGTALQRGVPLNLILPFLLLGEQDLVEQVGHHLGRCPHD